MEATITLKGRVAWIIKADPTCSYQQDEIVCYEPDPWCFTMADPNSPDCCIPRPITKIVYFPLED